MSRYPKGYRKPTDSCDGCLAWGDFSGRLCPACYMFGPVAATARPPAPAAAASSR